MTTRTFTSCLSDALALCGIPDSNAVEVERIGRFLNMAIRRAYLESDYWPRCLRVEERIVSEDGLLPYSEDGKEDIAVVRRVHATEPFAECAALEYPSYYSKGDGVQIAGYLARETSGDFGITISGDLSPNIAGTYPLGGTYPFDGFDGIHRPYYSTDGNSENPPVGNWTGVFYTSTRWAISYWDNNVNLGAWLADEGVEMTAAEASGWTPVAGTGTPIVETIVRYSAWITFKAALNVTYGTGDGEESEVPEEWADFAIYEAQAKFLSQDGNREAGTLASAEAFSTYLVPQLERLDNQSGGHVFTRNINHGNTQAR